MDADERVLLLAHPRSGSSNICEILQLHPQLRICDEPFNEHYVEWASGNTDYRDRVHDLASLEEQLDEIFRDFEGVKVLSYQLEEEWIAHLMHRRDLRVIFLRRRNLLQAVVSVLIAEQTGLWHHWDTTVDQHYPDLRPLELSEVSKRVRGLSEQMDRLDATADDRTDGRILKLVYEDLFFAESADRAAVVDGLWAFLGVPAIRSDRIDYFLRPERTKLNWPDRYRSIPNAQEIEDACGSHETGWLFQEPSHPDIA